MSTEIDEVVTKNGFTFKRKRKAEDEDLEYKKIKKEDQKSLSRVNDRVEVNLPNYEKGSKKEVDIPKKSILREGKFQPKPGEEPAPNEKQESRKPLADKRNTRASSKEERRQEKSQESRIVEIPANKNEEYKYNQGKENTRDYRVLKLPAFPASLEPYEFDLDQYEKIDPTKRLELMFSELSIHEKNLLTKEYKDHPVFIEILEKFIEQTTEKSVSKIQSLSQLRIKTSVKPKENLQNVYALQKRSILENMIKNYEEEIHAIDKFIEDNLSSNKIDLMAKNYLQYLENLDRVVLEKPLADRVEAHREEVGKDLTTAVKKSIAAYYKFDKEMAEIDKECRTIEKSLNRQTKLAHDKIFGAYMPVFETDPADLINEFLSE